MSLASLEHSRAPVMTEDVLKQARILILDDDVATLCLLKSVMQRFGFTNVREIDHPKRFAATFLESSSQVGRLELSFGKGHGR